MDVFSGKNRLELLEIIRKVFDYTESKEELLLKEMGQAPMAILQAPTTSNFANGHCDKEETFKKGPIHVLQKNWSLENECPCWKQVSLSPKSKTILTMEHSSSTIGG